MTWIRTWCLGALAAGAWLASCALDRSGELEETTTPAGAATGTGTPSGTETGTTTGTTTGTSTGTTTGTSTGSGGSGAAGGTGGSGGPGGGPTESNCLNGGDDDGDTLADCDDPDCSGYECVDATAIAGARYAFPVGPADPCPAGTAEVLLDDCEPICSCTANPGACWEWADVYGQNNCGGGSGRFTNECRNNNDGNRWFNGGVSLHAAGSCTPVSSGPSPQGWRACVAGLTGYCSSGGACVPTVTTATADCVLIAGAASCAAPYPGPAHTLHDPSLETCSCGCTAGPETCPSGAVTVYTTSDYCDDGSGTDLPLNGQCQAAGYIWSFKLEELPSQLTCTPTSAGPEPTPPSTLCCKQ